jgi:two-component system NtrC family sensor kinase
MADLRTEYEVSQKQAEIDLLNQKRERNYFIGLALLFFTLFLVVLAFLLYRNNRIKRAANKLLHKQNTKLELQHTKLEALNNTKDRFFSIVSHDLRGPVNAFNGISELIKYYIAHNEMGQLREVSEYIDKSARQLSTLLDNLLDWSVKQQGTFPFRPEMLYLNPLLQEITDMFRIAAHAKNITLNLDLDEEINVWADRNSLLTIIRNLLNNALKFTQSNGLVTLSAYTEKGFVHINVIDTGVGIPEDKLESLFLLKDKIIGLGTAGEKGLGIGLSLAFEFAEMNGGSIIVNSEEGIGSIFTLKMPLNGTDQRNVPVQQYEVSESE